MSGEWDEKSGIVCRNKDEPIVCPLNGRTRKFGPTVANIVKKEVHHAWASKRTSFRHPC